MMALNAKLWRDGGFEHLIVNNGFECQTMNDDFERQTKYTALNDKMNNGYECQTKKTRL